jgi:polysaccharide chain length determinant protein (PEP-CTERM system associated)
MFGHREMKMEDYTSILRRRVWLIVLPAVILGLAAFGVSLKLPKKYESTTTVLVEAQRVSDTLVKSLETGDPNEKLVSMKEQIMSNSRLQPIVERFGLFGDTGSTIEGRVAELRKVIVVTPVEPFAQTRASALPGFRISVTLGEAHLAQQVCSEITSMFVEEDLRGRERGAANTTDFMSEQVLAAQEKMNEQDKKLAQFKLQYLGALPDQEAANLNLLTGINSQMDAVTQALAREESAKGLWEAELSQRLSDWNAAKASGISGAASPATLDTELKTKETELAKLQDKFTDDWPNVKAKKQEIEDLKKKIAAAAAAPVPSDKKDKPVTAVTASTVESEAIQQLRARINASNLTIQDKERQQAALQSQYKLYQSRVQSSPLVEQKYNELTRDSKAAMEDYNQLLHKRDDAAMSAALQRRQQGEQFHVLDPASLPNRPTFPNQFYFAGAGFGGGLLLGLTLALLLEFRDKSLRTEADVEMLLKLPILAMVPVMESKQGTLSRIVFRARTEPPSLPAKS